MSVGTYLEARPFSDLIPYKAESPSDAVGFIGALRKHPYDDEKCLLIADPTGCEPAIFEFRLADVLGAEEMPSPIDAEGKNISLVKLWIRRGSFGIRYEPFEVDEPLKRTSDSLSLAEHLLKTVRCWG
jgi:inorganic pyrophosphatase